MSDIWNGGWKPAGSNSLHSWTNPARLENWDQVHPYVTGCQLILPKRPKGTLLDNHPKKRVYIAKYSLLDILNMELLSIIDDWITSFEKMINACLSSIE